MLTSKNLQCDTMIRIGNCNYVHYQHSIVTMQSYQIKLDWMIPSNTREYAIFNIRVCTTIVENYIVAIYYSNMLQHEFESLVIEFDKNVFSSKKNIIVGIFYRAPTSSLKLFN